MNTIKQELPMNATELDMYTSLPLRYSKHQGVFGKYAATEAAMQSGWAGDNFNAFAPTTPLTPSIDIPTNGINSVKTELLTPESLQTISPDELLTADNSPLFDEIDFNEMQNWESLFLEEENQVQDVNSGQAPTNVNTNTGANNTTSTQNANILNTSSESCLSSSEPIKSSSSATSSPIMNEEFALTDSLDFSVLDQLDFQDNASSSLSRGLLSKAQAKHSPAMKPLSPPAGGVSKSSASKKVDDLGITVYQRKPRSAPLKPVEVPEDADDVLAKRAKNTEAARRSRARKLERMSQLEERVRELLTENEQLRAELAELKGK